MARRPLAEYINSPKLRPYAERAAALLKRLPQLKVAMVQYKPPGLPDTAWYIAFASRTDLPLMNWKIIPSTFNVEFRFSQYLPQSVADRLNWQNSSWKYASYKQHGEKPLWSLIKDYLSALKADFDSGRLKRGGTSFAEKMVRAQVEGLYPESEIRCNCRPDDLRSERQRPLELDLYVPELRLAIEVQGPQHFRPLRGPNEKLIENDQIKKRWCRARGIKLMWMNWDEITNGLLRMPAVEQAKHLRAILARFLEGKHRFLWWKSAGCQCWE